MDASEWKRRYCKRLMERGGLTQKEAEENFDAGFVAKAPGVWQPEDFDGDPEMCADDEMSYWMEG